MPAAVAAAFIHHYTFMSDEEWARKKQRGRPRKGVKFARRQGDVDPLFSAVYDTTLTDRFKLLAENAAQWSARPALARRCAASLMRSDSHFDERKGGFAVLAQARAALPASAGAHARVASVLWC